MHNELLSSLDNKIQSLIEEVELLRMEVTELRDAKTSLEEQQQQWEGALKGMLDKFEQLNQL
ncbi:cell division protein ZapB [Pokkaliibacter sp. CJK22405]|uniref:cell division protein ZapB n=1 Tax=Pokkaliibacter sp. CJK22405 TaxID=3384615 RepID=UPI0039853F6F